MSHELAESEIKSENDCSLNCVGLVHRSRVRMLQQAREDPRFQPHCRCYSSVQENMLKHHQICKKLYSVRLFFLLSPFSIISG